MLRNIHYILTILLLTCCTNTERKFAQDFIIINEGFTPTINQIDKANSKLLNYLETKTKNGETIYINSLDGKVSLQDQLKYYKRRYIGKKTTEGEQIIRIEFVFVRCGGQDEWKKIQYTKDGAKDCWWSVLYNADRDEVYSLTL